MYSAADYVEMLIIYGECGNEVNPHALFSRAFHWSIRESCGMSSIEISLHVS
jgi:hypothetical protein